MKKGTVRDKRLETTGLSGFSSSQNRYSDIGLIKKGGTEGMTMGISHLTYLCPIRIFWSIEHCAINKSVTQTKDFSFAENFSAIGEKIQGLHSNQAPSLPPPFFFISLQAYYFYPYPGKKSVLWHLWWVYFVFESSRRCPRSWTLGNRNLLGFFA